jgi:hypothetical protein
MSLVISKRFNGVTDPDAGAYIAAVEAADGQLLEFAVGKAINDFVVGCKLDGIWNAIKASCILAGARTLSGALVPLAGTAPTNNNFVSGDYGRKTGLIGNGATKYLDSNRANNADPQNSNHYSVYLATAFNGAGNALLSSFVDAATGRNYLDYRIQNRGAQAGITSAMAGDQGLIGTSRASATSFDIRIRQLNYIDTGSSSAPDSGSITLFARKSSVGVVSALYGGRLAFYSIGESLDLALLDARVSALITAFGVAIP